MKRIASIVVGVTLALSACSPVTQTAEEERRSDECVRVSKAKQRAVVGANRPVGRAWAVKSDDFENVYMIASKFRVDGETLEGVWGSNDLRRNRGLIVAVDGFASEFTDFPNKVNGEKFSIADHGAEEALSCL